MTTDAAIQGTLGERRYDLDWVRIGAFTPLILYHVGMHDVAGDWHVKRPAASQAIEPLMVTAGARAPTRPRKQRVVAPLAVPQDINRA